MKKSPRLNSKTKVSASTENSLPNSWRERFRRELSPSVDSRSIQAVLAIRAVAYLVEVKLGEWLSSDDLGLGEFNVLISLWGAEGHARTMSDVSRALVASPASATKLVSQLEVEGLVRRHPDTHDKRSVIVRLTAKGEKLMESVAPRQIARVEDAMTTVPGWVCEALIEFLGQVRNGFEPNPV